MTWYSLIYVAASVSVYLLLLLRIKKGESPPGINKDIIFTYLLWAYVGLLVTVWKCGYDCSWDDPKNVRKWVSDVELYFDKFNQEKPE